MTVTVLVFAALREALGAGSVTHDLPEGATGADLLDGLAAEHPEVARYKPVIRLAVNHTYVPAETVLHADDEVALITPVSGG